jgi:DNA-binding CsgD family transcriptional regulator
MPGMNGTVRDHVLSEMRVEIHDLAAEGLSAEEIDRRLNGHRRLTEAEKGMIELLTYHTIAEANGRY